MNTYKLIYKYKHVTTNPQISKNSFIEEIIFIFYLSMFLFNQQTRIKISQNTKVVQNYQKMMKWIIFTFRNSVSKSIIFKLSKNFKQIKNSNEIDIESF